MFEETVSPIHYTILDSYACFTGIVSVLSCAIHFVYGTNKSLKDNHRAKATGGAIIDGMGSLGAAVGPLLSGWVSDDFVSFSKVKIYNLQR